MWDSGQEILISLNFKQFFDKFRWAPSVAAFWRSVLSSSGPKRHGVLQGKFDQCADESARQFLNRARGTAI